VENLEQAMSETIRYPAMRVDVISALESFSDPTYQATVWGRVSDENDSFDDLTIDVNILLIVMYSQTRRFILRPSKTKKKSWSENESKTSLSRSE
jgi:hypothetical protein